ncbi:ELMO domain-containing protein 3 isoform X4 [Cricetulus griseus]|uniref:ELMO domain-containing protein 3 isoform X4 n=1 Tax=Cricetulus griseus TaxID=10029 RepID=A0A9J7JX62_CRIGR|nr:ELMO domain-containing protein 3 isoform X4 [Cricetulus griseus]XP_027285268.1 ELMO domain-containing protein 3 isoform X4 [Cricetulus griseus]
MRNLALLGLRTKYEMDRLPAASVGQISGGFSYFRSSSQEKSLTGGKCLCRTFFIVQGQQYTHGFQRNAYLRAEEPRHFPGPDHRNQWMAARCCKLGGAQSPGRMGCGGHHPSRPRDWGQLPAAWPAHLLQRGPAALPDPGPLLLQEKNPANYSKNRARRPPALPVRAAQAAPGPSGRKRLSPHHCSVWPGQPRPDAWPSAPDHLQEADWLQVRLCPSWRPLGRPGLPGSKSSYRPEGGRLSCPPAPAVSGNGLKDFADGPGDLPPVSSPYPAVGLRQIPQLLGALISSSAGNHEDLFSLLFCRCVKILWQELLRKKGVG